MCFLAFIGSRMCTLVIFFILWLPMQRPHINTPSSSQQQIASGIALLHTVQNSLNASGRAEGLGGSGRLRTSCTSGEVMCSGMQAGQTGVRGVVQAQQQTAGVVLQRPHMMVLRPEAIITNAAFHTDRALCNARKVYICGWEIC